jgi:hypothetical protein
MDDKLNSEQIKKKEELAKEITDLASSKGFKIISTIIFPRYQVVPDEGQLALKVLENLEAQLIISFNELEDDKDGQVTDIMKK